MKDKKDKTVHHSFIEIVDKFDHKPTKLWVGQGKEFYNSPMQKWLNDNDISMYSTLKTKIYKKMTTNNSKSYLDCLNKLVDEYYNSHHRSIDKKLVDADYSDLTKKFESSHKVPKFRVRDSIRTTKHKNVFSKSYTENWSIEISVIDSILKTNRWTHKTKNLNGERIMTSFLKK